MLGLSENEIVKRDFFAYQLAKFISTMGYRMMSRVHVEGPIDKLLELKKTNNVFLYTGLHKSLWETSGFLSGVHVQNLPIPYIGMGDNLVKGAFFQKVAARLGAFLVKRAKTRKDVIESSKKLKTYINYYLAHGIDVCLFPEGTRRNIPDHGIYGNFFPTTFEALLEYEKYKEQITAEYPGLTPNESYFVPFNIDYSKVREDHELVREKTANPRTLSIFDSLKMIKHIGDVYISFDEPFKTTDFLHKNRKHMAQLCRSRCLELVKILPINLVSRAFVDSLEGECINQEKILENIKANMEKLAHLADRFRGFTLHDQPVDILAKVATKNIEFRQPDAALIPFYSLYADYIGHYFSNVNETDTV